MAARLLVMLSIISLIALIIAPSLSGQSDDPVLAGTIKASEALVFPHNDVNITYDKSKREVYIKFTTPSSYKVNYSDFYLRWRDNQWVVLKEFGKARIPVDIVTVETNHDDMSGQMKITSKSEYIAKYAKLPNDEMWLRTASAYQKDKGSDKWVSVKY